MYARIESIGGALSTRILKVPEQPYLYNFTEETDAVS